MIASSMRSMLNRFDQHSLYALRTLSACADRSFSYPPRLFQQ